MDNEKEPIQLECSDGFVVSSSMKAVAKNSKEETKAIREETQKGSNSADFQDGQMTEHATVRGRTGPRDEIKVAQQFASKYNQVHLTDYCIDNSNQPKQNDMADKILTDNNSGNQLKVQITASDTSPWSDLAKGSFRRNGEAYQIHCAAIKEAISKKVKRYGNRGGVVLVLDGWFSVSKEVLDKFTDDEQDFLKSTGFDEIWFAGDENETTVKLF